eukprot:gene617-339_t
MQQLGIHDSCFDSRRSFSPRTISLAAPQEQKSSTARWSPRGTAAPLRAVLRSLHPSSIDITTQSALVQGHMNSEDQHLFQASLNCQLTRSIAIHLLTLHDRYATSNGSLGVSADAVIPGTFVRALAGERQYVVAQADGVVEGAPYGGFKANPSVTSRWYIRLRLPKRMNDNEEDDDDPGRLEDNGQNGFSIIDFDLTSISNSPFTAEEFSEWVTHVRQGLYPGPVPTIELLAFTATRLRSFQRRHQNAAAAPAAAASSSDMSLSLPPEEATALGACSASPEQAAPTARGAGGHTNVSPPPHPRQQQPVSPVGPVPTASAGTEVAGSTLRFSALRQGRETSVARVEEVARRECLHQLSEEGTVFPRKFDRYRPSQLRLTERDLMDYLQAVRDCINEKRETCVICFDRPPTVILYPCKHRVICRQCALAGGCNACPLCRAVFKDMFEVEEVDAYTVLYCLAIEFYISLCVCLFFSSFSVSPLVVVADARLFPHSPSPHSAHCSTRRVEVEVEVERERDQLQSTARVEEVLTANPSSTATLFVIIIIIYLSAAALGCDDGSCICRVEVRNEPTMTAPSATAAAPPTPAPTAAAAAEAAVPDGVDPVYYALHLLRTRQLDRTIAVAANHLLKVPAGSSTGAPALDEQMWFIQTKALVQSSWYDDVELEGDGIGDDLESDHVVSRSTAAQNPRTSLLTGPRGTGGGTAGTAHGDGHLGPLSSPHGWPAHQQSVRGTAGGTAGGRASRAGAAVPGSRRAGGTAFRPITGRVMRLGTASLQSVPGGPHIHLERLALEKYARERPMIAKLLCDYLLYVEHRPRLAVELCLHALKAEETANPQKAHLSSGPDAAAGGASNASESGAVVSHRVAGASVLRRNLQEEMVQNRRDTQRPNNTNTNNALHLNAAEPDNNSGRTKAEAGVPPSAASAPVSAQPHHQPQVGIPVSQDWWWKARLGKANYQLGLLREAEKWFKASLYDEGSVTERGNGAGGRLATSRGAGRNRATMPQSTPGQGSSAFRHYNPCTVMELCKVYIKMDQPLTAMDLYRKAMTENPYDTCIMLCMARLQDELHDPEGAFESFASVLENDSGNVEALACVAAFYFYEKNQPELALRYYRRLLQMGVQRAEVWNNVALSAYLTSQYDFALSCFEKSLQLCEDDVVRADVWFNIGHVGIALGDVVFAERALRIAVALDPTHGEALNNLAVLALEKAERTARALREACPTDLGEKDDSAAAEKRKEESYRSEGKSTLSAVLSVAPFLEEALYNRAMIAFEEGELETAHQFVLRVLETHPEHPEALGLAEKLREAFSV